MPEEAPHILFGEELAAVRAEGLLEPYQRTNIISAFVLAWFLGMWAGLCVESLSMVLNLVLPWAAVAVAALYPSDFTLLPCFDDRDKKYAQLRYFHTSVRVPPASLSTWWAFSLVFAAYPQYVVFTGSQSVFLVDGLIVAAALFSASIVVIATRDKRPKPVTWPRVLVLLLLCLPCGYGAAKQSNVLLDRSSGVTYQTRVVRYLPHARGALSQWASEPFGPVQGEPIVPINDWFRDDLFLAGKPVCIVLRRGALGVSWYEAEECPKR